MESKYDTEIQTQKNESVYHGLEMIEKEFMNKL
jgi:hypothetical protein